ncbi:MAG: hypothetical protein U0521_23805 [Anaerolineae bacterium]
MQPGLHRHQAHLPVRMVIHGDDADVKGRGLAHEPIHVDVPGHAERIAQPGSRLLAASPGGDDLDFALASPRRTVA